MAMELQQLRSWTVCATPSLSCPTRLKKQAPPSPDFQRLWRPVRVSAEEKVQEKSAQKQGWFYNTFVAQSTMEAKLAKFKGDVAARDGFVGSWFKDSFRYTAWVEVHRKLTERHLRSLGCEEAHNLAKQGKAVLIDAREDLEFEATHAEGAISAPLFRQIQGNDTKANLRRLGYALLTDFAGTERNPDFVSKALEGVGGQNDKQVIVYCNVGGTLLTYVERTGPKAKKFADPERLFGRQSRSLRPSMNSKKLASPMYCISREVSMTGSISIFR